MTHRDNQQQIVHFNTKKRTNEKTINIVLTCSTILAIVFALFVIVTSSIYGAAEVVGLSMAPTINSAEYFGDTNTQNQIAFYTTAKTAQKGDIVIVDYKNANIKDLEAIKRLVAVGGDQICYYNGALMINGKPAAEPYLEQAYQTIKQQSGQTAADIFKTNAFNKSKQLFTEFCQGVLNETFTSTTFAQNYLQDYNNSITYNTTIDSYVLTIPKDFVFVLGDNRSNSVDSNTFGPIQSKHITSKVQYLAPYGSNIFEAMWLDFVK